MPNRCHNGEIQNLMAYILLCTHLNENEYRIVNHDETPFPFIDVDWLRDYINTTFRFTFRARTARTFTEHKVNNNFCQQNLKHGLGFYI